MSPRNHPACWGTCEMGRPARQPYSPGTCEPCFWTSRYGARSLGSACRHVNASVELHSIMPRLSLLGTPAVCFAERGYTWVKIGCKSWGLMGQFWVQINNQCYICSIGADGVQMLTPLRINSNINTNHYYYHYHCKYLKGVEQCVVRRIHINLETL